MQFIELHVKLPRSLHVVEISLQKTSQNHFKHTWKHPELIFIQTSWSNADVWTGASGPVLSGKANKVSLKVEDLQSRLSEELSVVTVNLHRSELWLCQNAAGKHLNIKILPVASTVPLGCYVKTRLVLISYLRESHSISDKKGTTKTSVQRIYFRFLKSSLNFPTKRMKMCMHVKVYLNFISLQQKII